MDRREFLKFSLMSGALYGAGGLPMLTGTARADGFAPLAQRVLVNVMLQGGPDFRHLMPPPFDTDPQSYGYKYWEVKARAHSIDSSAASYEARWENDYFHVGTDTETFGILKSCGWLKRMWDANNVAIICNALGATTRDHHHCQLVMDQGNLQSGPNDFDRSGWGGRLAAVSGGNLAALTRAPRRFCYGPHPTNPDGHDNTNLVGVRDSRNLGLFEPPPGTALTHLTARMSRALKSYYAAKRQELPRTSVYYRFLDMEQKLREFGVAVGERLATVPLPPSIAALYEGTLHSQYFGEQIRNLYDVLAASDILDLRVASLEHGSFDSHSGQRDFLEPKLEDMFGDGKAFDSLYQELPDQVADNIVLVFAGEFGRQLRANGDNGSDHGRGNQILVIGNAVNGGVYGEMFPESELARHVIAGADIDGLTEFDHIFGQVCDWVVPGGGDFVFPSRSSAALEAGLDLGTLFA